MSAREHLSSRARNQRSTASAKFSNTNLQDVQTISSAHFLPNIFHLQIILAISEQRQLFQFPKTGFEKCCDSAIRLTQHELGRKMVVERRRYRGFARRLLAPFSTLFDNKETSHFFLDPKHFVFYQHDRIARSIFDSDLLRQGKQLESKIE
jgi:hypothetical protein